jgi:PilZ domain
MLANARQEPRETFAAQGTLYHSDGTLLFLCGLRDLSRSGAKLELLNKTTLPRFFWLSLMPDGSARRLCSKIWQLDLLVGVRFIEK